MAAGTKLRRMTVLDALLVAGLVALPVLALVRSLHGTDGRAAAYVYQAGRLIGVYPLSADRTILIGDPARPDMKIEIAGGRVRVAESDCPKGVCLHTGWVSRPGRPIVCLPNKVLIEVKGGEAERRFDVESY